MSSHAEKVAAFRALHIPGQPLLIPNPWDAGTARLLVSLGFHALATTSSGHAATLGRLDGLITRDEALDHAAAIARAVDAPVSADLENGFADDPGSVFATVAAAAASGLAGCSIEDFTGRADHPIYPIDLAAERIAAAARAAHAEPGLLLTARAENVGLPVNVLARPGVPPVAALAAVGVARISVGGAFSQVALAALADAAGELLDRGTYTYLDQAARGRQAGAAAFRVV